MPRLLFWRRQRHFAIPRWLRRRMLSLRAWTEMRENAVADADHAEGRGAFGWVVLSTLLVIGAACLARHSRFPGVAVSARHQQRECDEEREEGQS